MVHISPKVSADGLNSMLNNVQVSYSAFEMLISLEDRARPYLSNFICLLQALDDVLIF